MYPTIALAGGLRLMWYVGCTYGHGHTYEDGY